MCSFMFQQWLIALPRTNSRGDWNVTCRNSRLWCCNNVSLLSLCAVHLVVCLCCHGNAMTICVCFESQSVNVNTELISWWVENRVNSFEWNLLRNNFLLPNTSSTERFIDYWIIDRLPTYSNDFYLPFEITLLNNDIYLFIVAWMTYS